MLNKFSAGFLSLISIVLFSCNADLENKKSKKDNLPTQEIPPAANSQTPPSDLALLEKKFEADSMNYDLRIMLAANYYAAGILNKAAYHFYKIYEHDNKNLIALNNLGNICYDTNQDDKAIEFYEKALHLDPKNIDTRCDLATCYSRINRIKKSIQILRENITMNANHKKSHYNLSMLLKQSGNIAEAETEMNIYKALASEKQ